MQEGVTSVEASLGSRVSAALANLDMAQASVDHNQRTSFWRQCVRDTSGKWLAYANQGSAYDVPYFHGKQETYKTPGERKYLLAHLDTRRAFYEALTDVDHMNLDEFRNWLDVLRALLEYRKSESALHEKSITDKHTKIVTEQVVPLAKKYDDPYFTGDSQGPVFDGLPSESLPYDEKRGDLVYHHYPSLEYADIYLEKALEELKTLLHTDAFADQKEYVHKVARFFQLLINLHLFAAVNASLYMNMADGLLEIAGLRGIEHGLTDFVAFRLQPDSFERYFYDIVMDGQ
jgi:hypothetical protein